MQAPQNRPVYLSQRFAERTLGPTDAGEINRVIRLVGKLEKLHDSLQTLRHTPDPQKTREANALEYRRHFDRAQSIAKRETVEAAEALAEMRARVRRDAEVQAGLHKPFDRTELAEIRATLRGMSDKERDKVLKDAALAGDAAIIRAVRDAPSEILTGRIGVPIDALETHFVESQVPELPDQMASIDRADTHLEGAADAFVKTTSGWREQHLEQQAEKQADQVSAAEAVMQDAMGGDAHARPGNV